jgi:anti-sigma factor RsiW
MLDCQSLDALVTPYIDGELSESDRRAVDAHLRRCPPCHSRVAAERAVHDLCHDRQSAIQSPPAPPSLRSACRRIANESAVARTPAPIGVRPATPTGRLATGRRPTLRARLAPFALAASLVVIVGGAFVYQATDKSARVLAAELAADHVKCFAMNRVLATHEDARAVESSLISGFNWHVHLPQDLSRAQLELVGARPCLYGKGKIAHIMYRHDGHPVSLFMLPDTTRAHELVEVLGHEAAIWCNGNRTFVLVAREPKREVEQLASFVEAGLH